MEQVKYDVFISYSRKDYVDEHDNVIPGNEVSKIIKALSDAKISYWMDKKGVVSGEDFAEKIHKNIKASKILVYISSASANQSDWTKKEIACALKYKKKLIPLLLDDTPFHDAVMMRIVDLDWIDYYLNPEKGVEKLITSIKSHLNELAEEDRLRHQKELQKQLIEDIRTSVKELNIEETKLDLERSKLLVKTEKVTDIGLRESLKTEITESSPIRKKIVAEIEKLRKIVADWEAKWNDEVRKNEALLKGLADKESENGTLQKEIDSLKQKQYGENKWVHIVYYLIILMLISFICFLVFDAPPKNSILESPVDCNLEFKADSILEFYVDGVKFNMIRVEGGTFKMGADTIGDNKDSEAERDESPVHNVTLDSYYIGETEVTQALWKVVMGSTVVEQREKAHPDLKKEVESRGEGDDFPMYNVGWNGCQSFIDSLNKKLDKKLDKKLKEKLDSITGKKFRLPTEAEWEFAARGGNQSNGYKYSGSKNIDTVAWYESNSEGKTHEVKTKSPNELGIYDMIGNVWEWCQDRYGEYSSSEQTNPTGPSSGSRRVLRGGGWSYRATYCRVSDRDREDPDYFGSSSIGFRLVLPIEASPEKP